MATYTVIPAVDRTGLHVAIQGSDGTRQTILGFETSVEAEAWIEHDRRLSAAQPPGIQLARECRTRCRRQSMVPPPVKKGRVGRRRLP
jgi:hypothetical protein